VPARQHSVAPYTPFMWVMTPDGFFSIVRKRGETDLTVRARSRGDLEALEKEYLPSLGPIISHGGTDYHYRARVDSKRARNCNRKDG